MNYLRSWLSILFTFLPALNLLGNEKPNILFILSDDHQAGLLGCYGHPDIKTPHIDQIAKSGIKLTNIHAESPCCSPSRTSLMTGCSSFEHKVMEPKYVKAPFPKHLSFMPKTFSDNGYTSFLTGKWNSPGSPQQYGFHIVDRVMISGFKPHDKLEVKGLNEKIYKGYSTDIFAEAAIEFLAKKQKEPFFLMLAFAVPHDPRITQPKYKAIYPEEKITIPPNFLPEYPMDNGMLRDRDEKLMKWPRKEEDVKRELSNYYAMITHMDKRIGDVIAQLEKSGLKENTIIIYASDHGLALGQHGLLGKQNMHHHSVASPFVMQGPGIPLHETRDTLCYLHDLFPTLCELTGIPLPEKVSGKSFINALKDASVTNYETIFCHNSTAQRMVRDRRYKLVRYYSTTSGGRKATSNVRDYQLYDTQKDPWEANDLSREPEMQPILKRLGKDLETWQKKLADPNRPIEANK